MNTILHTKQHKVSSKIFDFKFSVYSCKAKKKLSSSYGVETEREDTSRQTEEDGAKRNRRGSWSSGIIRIEENCSRSREMEGCSNGFKNSEL